MAVTAIWSVNGSLARPLDYITQDKKVMVASTGAENDLSHIMGFAGQEEALHKLEKVLGYAMQEEKTAAPDKRFVTGINCNWESAMQEMQRVKDMYSKTGGVACYHGYQSFRIGEISPELAHNIGVELARQLWGDRYQVTVATHLDQPHIHNHFVINAVSFVDGKKLRGNRDDYDKMRLLSDKLCSGYGLSIVDRPKTGRLPNPKIYKELGIEKPMPMYQKIRQDVDMAIQASRNMSEFYGMLRGMGYTFRRGNLKYFTIKAPDAERAIRLDKRFGAAYSPEEIEKRIAGKAYAIPEPPRKRAPQKQRNYRGNFTKLRKRKSHFRRMYLYYCYMFGVIPKRKQHYRPPVSRQELRKMRSIAGETRLLLGNHIDTPEQLLSYEANKKQQLKALLAQRKQAYNRQSYAKGDIPIGDPYQSEIDRLNAQIRSIREQLALCKRIWERTKNGAGIPDRKDDAEKKLKNEEANKVNQKGEKINDGTRCSQHGCKRSDTPVI